MRQSKRPAFLAGGSFGTEESTMKRMRSMNLVLRVRIGAALAMPLLAASPSVVAWGPNAFYPTPVDPLMPGPERAQQLRIEVPGML
jgi:hypothetical protein